MSPTGRRLPADLELERSVLGAALLSRACWEAAREQIGASAAWYDPRHAALWAAGCRVEASGEAVDPVTVLAALRASQGLLAAGGPEYARELTADVLATPEGTEAGARRLAALASQRALVEVCMRVAAEGVEGVEDVSDYLDRAQQSVAQVVDGRPASRRAVTLAESQDAAMAQIIERAERGATMLGRPTGLRQLDFMLSGYEPGKLYVLAGRPGMGKSAFAQLAAQSVAATGAPALVVSLEMAHASWSERWMASEGDVDGQRLRMLQLDRQAFQRLDEATQRLAKLPVEILDDSDATLLDIAQHGRRMRRERGELGLIVIDYLQLMRSAGTFQSREQEVASLSVGCKRLAKDLRVPVLLLAQLNRDSVKRADKRPQLTDLRESGSIEQDADAVLLLHRDGYHDSSATQHEAEVIIAKQRAGATGVVKVSWQQETTRFGNLEARYDAE